MCVCACVCFYLYNVSTHMHTHSEEERHQQADMLSNAQNTLRRTLAHTLTPALILIHSLLCTVAGTLTRAACLAGEASTPRKNKNVVMTVVHMEPNSPPGTDVLKTVKSKKLPGTARLNKNKHISSQIHHHRAGY